MGVAIEGIDIWYMGITILVGLFYTDKIYEIDPRRFPLSFIFGSKETEYENLQIGWKIK